MKRKALIAVLCMVMAVSIMNTGCSGNTNKKRKGIRQKRIIKAIRIQKRKRVKRLRRKQRKIQRKM